MERDESLDLGLRRYGIVIFGEELAGFKELYPKSVDLSSKIETLVERFPDIASRETDTLSSLGILFSRGIENMYPIEVYVVAQRKDVADFTEAGKHDQFQLSFYTKAPEEIKQTAKRLRTIDGSVVNVINLNRTEILPYYATPPEPSDVENILTDWQAVRAVESSMRVIEYNLMALIPSSSEDLHYE